MKEAEGHAERLQSAQDAHQRSQEIDPRPSGHQRRKHKFVIREQYGESDRADQNRGGGRTASDETDAHCRDGDIPYEREHCRESCQCSPGRRRGYVYRSVGDSQHGSIDQSDQDHTADGSAQGRDGNPEIRGAGLAKAPAHRLGEQCSQGFALPIQGKQYDYGHRGDVFAAAVRRL